MKKVAEYGIRFLDDKLCGIFENELVLIGAGTGVGKSTLANLIAVSNSEQGITPALFSLENSKGDTVIKEAWKLWKKVTNKWSVSFREWEILMEEKPEERIACLKQADDLLKNVILFERKETGYTIQDIEKDAENAVKQGAKIIIVDHIDYFSEPENEVNENKTAKKNINALARIRDKYGIPIICFSQFRKLNDKNIILPSLDDFFGSSEKTKIATTVLSLARDYEFPVAGGLYPTFCGIRKDRYGNLYGARIFYDNSYSFYAGQYDELKFDYWGTKFKVNENA